MLTSSDAPKADRSRLPNWALALSYATQDWLLKLSDSVLSDPRLWLVLQDFEGLPQTDQNLQAITYFVLERRCGNRT